MKTKFEYDKVSYGSGTSDPFLTVITRKHKRPLMFEANIDSIKRQTDCDIEQIFITDPVGYGMLEANKAFSYVTEMVNGKFVYLLDDDDFLINDKMVEQLKQVPGNPDVIFFRMTIKNGMNNNHYPTDKLCWGNKPVIARIGGSCFVVKTEVWKKYIHEFGKVRCGDFYFIDAVVKGGASMYWLDVLMAETRKVSRGKPE